MITTVFLVNMYNCESSLFSIQKDSMHVSIRIVYIFAMRAMIGVFPPDKKGYGLLLPLKMSGLYSPRY